MYFKYVGARLYRRGGESSLPITRSVVQSLDATVRLSKEFYLDLKWLSGTFISSVCEYVCESVR